MEIKIDLINRRVSNFGVAGRRRGTAEFFVLDRNYRVLIGEVKNDYPFPVDIIGTVRTMTGHWSGDLSSQTEEVGLASPSWIVRVFPLQGRDEWTMGVYAEPYRRRPTLAERAETFGLKPTEYEVIRLLSEGLTEADTAAALDLPVAEFQAWLALINCKVGVKGVDELLAKISGKRV